MRPSQLLASSTLSLPADTYIYDVISVSGDDKLATISSNDTLRLFDKSLQLPSNGAFNGIHDGVTCLENFEASVGCLATAGRDAAVNVWDPRVGSQRLLQIRGEYAAESGRNEALRTNRSQCSLPGSGFYRQHACGWKRAE